MPRETGLEWPALSLNLRTLAGRLTSCVSVFSSVAQTVIQPTLLPHRIEVLWIEGEGLGERVTFRTVKFL